jgi:hypothetical protein
MKEYQVIQQVIVYSNSDIENAQAVCDEYNNQEDGSIYIVVDVEVLEIGL